MNTFENEIRKSADRLDIYYTKLPVATKLAYKGGTPFLLKLQESPYDGFVVHQGRHIPLEMKSQAVYDSFPLDNIASHQVLALKTMVDLGCTCYLLINQRSVLMDGKKVSNNRAWALDFRRWGELMLLLAGRKSIPVELFETGAPLIEIPRIHIQRGEKPELVWDLRLLLSEEPHLYRSPEPWYRRLGVSLAIGSRKKRSRSPQKAAADVRAAGETVENV